MILFVLPSEHDTPCYDLGARRVLPLLRASSGRGNFPVRAPQGGWCAPESVR